MLLFILRLIFVLYFFVFDSKMMNFVFHVFIDNLFAFSHSVTLFILPSISL